ncbi:substrate-binding domain-containing protein, partial [Delftia tsuruhatensis]|uniref:substrate-binding domain-containing protein n=1 Tax=Delftia tsuruhatensis TaxID=180282 RepID=UPI001EF3DDD6
MLSRRPDGIVLTGTEHTARTRRLLVNADVPVVELWDYQPHPLDMVVGFSQEDAGRAAFRHLAACGYRRPAILRADDSRAARRARGFARAAAEAGAPEPVQIVFSESIPQAGRGRDALDALRAQAPGADSVFCSSDALAQGVLSHAHALGLDVPGAFGVLGFGDQAQAQDAWPALSTVRVDGAAIGRLGAEALIARMAGGTAVAAQDVGFEVVGRAST